MSQLLVLEHYRNTIFARSTKLSVNQKGIHLNVIATRPAKTGQNCTSVVHHNIFCPGYGMRKYPSVQCFIVS